MAVLRPTPPRGDSKKSRFVQATAFPQPENVTSGGGAARSGTARSGLVRSGFARSGFGRSGVARSGRSSRTRGTTRPLFNRLTVVWVQRSGVPFTTTGFFATLSRGNVIVDTAFFDPFGVVRFNNVRTLTNVTLTLRVFDRNGILFRTRTIPPGVETFAIIG